MMQLPNMSGTIERRLLVNYRVDPDVLGRQDGIELSCGQWKMEPVVIDHVASSFFDDQALFPARTVELDSALLMRDIPATWKARAQLTSLGAPEDTSTQCV